MKPEDRAAIVARNRAPAAPVSFATPKPLRQMIDAKEAHRANRAASEADEARTEGHASTRRPLSCPHEL
jgi:hypothetical protein